MAVYPANSLFYASHVSAKHKKTVLPFLSKYIFAKEYIFRFRNILFVPSTDIGDNRVYTIHAYEKDEHYLTLLYILNNVTIVIFVV